jgi:parallel beta-helix repeat protein
MLFLKSFVNWRRVGLLPVKMALIQDRGFQFFFNQNFNMINFLRNKALRGMTSRWSRRAIGMLAGALLLAPGIAQAQLSGTYTICDSGCDYSTIQAAADDLKTNGVSGPVTMQIQPGDYNEDVTVGAITGVSATNTVTFKGTGTKNTDVHIYKGTNSAAWYFNGTKWVILDNVHVEQVTYSSGYFGIYVQSSKNCTIRNCRITANTSSGIYNHEALRIQSSQDILFQNNWFRGGYTGIGNGTTNSGNARNIFDGNYFTKYYYYGIYMYYETDNKYLNNSFDSMLTSPAQACIYTYGNYGTTIYKGNRTKNCYYGINAYTNATDIIDSNYVNNCYYLWSYGLSSASDVTMTRNVVTNALGYGMFLYANGKLKVYNNMVSSSGGSYGMYVYPLSSAASLDIAHNTINWSSNYSIYFYNSSSAKDVKFRNNLMTGNGAGLYAGSGLTTGNIVDGNNTVRGSSGFYGNISGTSYTSLSSWQTALAAYGTGYQEQNTPVSYASSSDLHLDYTNPAPFGVNVGISTDIDGDSRCLLMPTVGADESKNKNGDNYKTITGTKFTAPTKTYIGYPTTFFNAAASSSRLGYSWYVDGVKVSDSFHLRTTALKYPKSKVQLVAFNCASTDTFTYTINVDSPATAPKADFISDVNVIRQGDVVQFTDLSTDYPSAWEWEITPEAGMLNGAPAAAYKYVYGTKNSDLTKVRFDIAGKYKVCLTSSNAKGKSSQECKVDYIEVQPAVTMKSGLQTITNGSGFIYDNGGPNGNVQTASYSSNLPKILIDACADSVYLVFKSFNMYCPYQFVRIFDGKDKQSGKELSCTSNKYSVYGPGLTGSASSSCSQNCSPIRNGATPGSFVYDTFKASKYMYIEMEANVTGSYPGFEAYYWTKPRTQQPPVASFSSVDSVCTNGQVTFTNTTSGQDVTYLWDLDDDMSFFEATSKNTNYPYFAPGKYKITLIAMNCGGVDTFTKTISVFNPQAPVTAFTADNLTPTTSDIVFFAKDMPMCVDEYKWNITAASGSGQAVYVNGSRNTSATPNVMFTDTGCYNVSLWTKNVTGEDSLKLNCYIKVRSSYCVPTTINKAADLGISHVVFNNINNTSPQGTTSYTNYALDQTKSTVIEIGVTYDLTVERNTNKNKITRTAWIDWNADGDFDDAGEKVGEQLNSSTLSWTTQVKVPTLAKTGATVLRIAVNQGTQNNTPCGPNVFGEYEDYRVYIRPDATKPVITLNGDDTVYVEQGYAYSDAGATASDNLDGNVTSKIKTTSVPKFDNMTPATYIYKYNVTDAAGNQADEVQRVVVVTPDKTGPDLVVPEPDTIYVEVFDQNFNAPDAVLAEDLVDGDLLSEVQKSGNVNVNVVGTYEVVYSVTDASGNNTTVKRVVIVQDLTAPVLTLNGNSTVTHEVGTPYTDLDVTISDNYYADTVLRKALVIQGNVDVNKLGTYTIVYTLTDPSGNGPVTVTRTVIVVDTQAPAVTLVGDSITVIEVKTKFMDPGVNINDNYDKNLTWDTLGTFYATFADGFASQLGSYSIVYEVTDASGNVTSVTRTVVVKDMTAPVATLKGTPAVTVCRWENYTDSGVNATDNFNTTAELKVTPEGTFTTSGTQIAGLWTLRYKVEDKSGNVTYTEWRNILVQEPGQGGCITGINEQDAMAKYVNVYPNPNSGKFNVSINMPKAEQVKITITNLVGQQIAVVTEGMISADILTVDLSMQPSGVYMLNIQTATQNVVKRIVINK